MGRKVRIGIAKNLFAKDGKFYIPGHGLKHLDDIPGVEWEMMPEYSSYFTPEQIQEYDMIVILLDKLTRESLVGNDRLISVHCNAVGYDQLDVPMLTEAGVAIFHTPEATRRPMASSIIAFILALSLNLIEKNKVAREGRWSERGGTIGIGLVGRTLGTIGAGRIGHDMLRLAKAFGMRHIACDPYLKQSDLADVNAELVDMDRVLAESDFLNVSCLLNKETRHLIGETELSKMKKTAYLINTSRGPVIDEAALIKALQKKWIKGAAIDVFEEEPTPDDNPLLKMENVIVTPHCIGSTDEVWINKWEENVEQIAKIIKGEIPEAFVNREVWEQPKFQAKLQKFQEAIS